MHSMVWLTVSESKRLIAKGVAALPEVRAAFAGGTLAVAPGTTNGYVVEELTGHRLDKTLYVTGNTMPAKYEGPRPQKQLADFVFRRGVRLEMPAVEAVRDMVPGDVFIKGANALNYDRQQAGVLIGHPTGGTLGAVLGTVIARRLHLIHPVGLEKNIPGDLHEAARLQVDRDGTGPTLWVSPGRIFTEIEALRVLCGIRAVPVGAGGIGGAEGAVWLMLLGEADDLARAELFVHSIHGEPPFLSGMA